MQVESVWEGQGPMVDGVRIIYVYASGPAQRAGLSVGDQIETIGGARVREHRSFSSLLRRLAIGETAALGVRRGGQLSEMQVVPEDGASVFRRACDAGDTEGCTSLGMMLDEGDGVEADPAAARPILQASCDSGSYPACINLGNMYRKGVGGETDVRVAMGLFERACTAGVPTGCFNVGILHLNGEGTPRDTGTAARYFGAACELGDAEACMMARRALVP